MYLTVFKGFCRISQNKIRGDSRLELYKLKQNILTSFFAMGMKESKLYIRHNYPYYYCKF